MLDTKIKSSPRYQFPKFFSINQIPTDVGTNQVPLAQSTTLLVPHRRKSLDADALLLVAAARPQVF
jgi:hypothetical protein